MRLHPLFCTLVFTLLFCTSGCGDIKVTDNGDTGNASGCKVDDDCKDSGTCRVASCGSDGTCNYTLKNDYCFIEGTCYNESQAKPGNSCRVCDSKAVQTEFVNLQCDGDESCNEKTGQCEEPLPEDIIEDTGETDAGVEDTGPEDTFVEDTAIEDTTVEDTTVEDTTPAIDVTPAPDVIAIDDVATAPDAVTVEDIAVAEDTFVEDTFVEDTAVEDTAVEDTFVEPVPTSSTCSNPTAITAGSSTLSSNEGVTSDYVSGCTATPPPIPGSTPLPVPDVVFSFIPGTSGLYNFQVVGSAPYPLLLTIVTSCPTLVAGAEASVGCSDETPYFFHDFFSKPDSSLEVSLEANTTYYVIVDGYSASEVGEFSLSVSNVCVPECPAGGCGDNGCGQPCTCDKGLNCVESQCVAPPTGQGDTCADPISFISPTFTDSNDSSDFTSNYTSCAGNGAGFPDVVYKFNPLFYTGPVKATITWAVGVPPMATLLSFDSVCPTNSKSCEGKDFFDDPSALEVCVVKGNSYYFTVDSLNANEVGPYTFTLSLGTKKCGLLDPIKDL